MKHISRTLTMILALCMLLVGSAFAEVNLESTFPIVTEPLCASIAFVPAWAMVTSEYNEDTFWEIRYLRDVTGMDLKFTLIDPSVSSESISLMMASGDLPDLVIGADLTAAEITNYAVTQGLLYPIDELLQYMPTFSKILEERPSIRASITAPDGHIYTFPTMSYGDYAFSFRTWINQKWLDNLGLENPTTIDELYEVLKAFKEQDANGNGDPNDEIPWSGGWDLNYNLMGTLEMAYGLPYSQNSGLSFDYSDGKDGSTIVYSAVTDTYKELLTFVNKLWNEGIIDPDYFTQTEIQAYAKVAEDRVGVIGATSPDSMGSDLGTFVSMNALTLNKGDTPIVSGYPALRDLSRGFISADADPEVAAAMANLIDYYYTDEAFINEWYGPELDSEYDYDHTGMYYDAETKSPKYVNSGNTFWWNYKITYFNFWEVPGTTNVGNKFIEASWAESHPDSLIAQYIADCGQYADWQQDLIDHALKYEVEGIPAMFMSDEDSEEITMLKVDLDSYSQSMVSKFVIGEASLDTDWDAYIATMEDYGVNEYVDMYNSYYKTFKENMAN